MLDNKTKVTKEVLCEDARFILANVMAEARYGRQNRYEDIRRVCEGSLKIPFADYIQFLDASGYLRHDRATESLEVTPEGEGIVNGGNLSEFTERAVAHFKQSRRRKDEVRDSSSGVRSLGTPAPVRSSERPLGAPARSSERLSRAGELPVDEQTKQVSLSSAEAHRPAADDRYEKIESIGSGAIGTVYRARQVLLDRPVALKELREVFTYFGEELRPELMRRFTEVIQAAARLAHPNILPIHDIGVDTEFPYVVSELASNSSCRRLISEAETIPVELVLKYLLQTLSALQAAHAHQVFHRGLKPENLLIDGYGNIKVSDFGFTRIVERDAVVIRQAYVGMDNIAYMAPELYQDPSGAGAQSDIYALGIIFYELLTRRLPGRRSPMPSEVNSSLPQGIDDIFDRMTRDARAERYTSVAEIFADLNRLDGLSTLLDAQTQQALDVESSVDMFPDSSDPSIYTSAPDPSQGGDKPKSSYRPYSYQQRKKR